MVKVKGTPSLNKSSTFFCFPRRLLPVVGRGISGFGVAYVMSIGESRLARIRGRVFRLTRDRNKVRIFDVDSVVACLRRRVSGVGVPLCKLMFFVTIFKLVDLVGALVAGVVSERRRFNVLRSIKLGDGRFSGVLRARYFCCITNATVLALAVKALTKFVLYGIFGRIKAFKTLACRFPILRVDVCFMILFLVLTTCSLFSIQCYGECPIVRHVGAVR